MEYGPGNPFYSPGLDKAKKVHISKYFDILKYGAHFKNFGSAEVSATIYRFPRKNVTKYFVRYFSSQIH